MARKQMSVRIDPVLKDDATAILEEVGVDFSTAIEVFLKAVVRERGIPFKLQAQRPKVECGIVALEEAADAVQEVL